ncbi:MAG: hypothetical protein RDV48_12920 [Candidatus Eremiobacteraeota bacterium]|nr:hypothetical protein [Candidatus Eremiobacteraeota bacterium]
MKKSLQMLLTVLLLLAAFCCACPAPAAVPGSAAPARKKVPLTDKNKAPLGKWAENDVLKIKVVKVEEADTWEKIPLNKRISSAREGQFNRLQRSLQEGKAKVVLVTAQVKNAGARDVNIGWNARGYCNFFLRGDEGTVQGSSNIFSTIGNHSIVDAVNEGKKLPPFIEGGFPEDAITTPGGTVQGRILFVVPSFFTPSVFYTDAKRTSQWWGKMEIIIKLEEK